jgi:hypothetical protein
VLSLLLALGTALAGSCEVSGAFRGPVEVDPPETSAFSVFVENGNIEARIERTSAGAIPVQVKGALGFEGTSKNLDFYWYTSDPLPSAVLALRRGTNFRILDSAKTGEGDDAKRTYTLAFHKTPITVSGVSMPCNGVKLGLAGAKLAGQVEPPKWASGPDDKKRWKLAPGPVRSEANGGESVEVAATDGYTPVVRKLEEKDGWAHVVIPLGTTAWIDGWVETSRLSAYEGDYVTTKPAGATQKLTKPKGKPYAGADVVTIADGAAVVPSPGAEPWAKLKGGSYLIAPASGLDYEEFEQTRKERRQTEKQDWYMLVAVPGYASGGAAREWVKDPVTGKLVPRVPNAYVSGEDVQVRVAEKK